MKLTDHILSRNAKFLTRKDILTVMQLHLEFAYWNNMGGMGFNDDHLVTLAFDLDVERIVHNATLAYVALSDDKKKKALPSLCKFLTIERDFDYFGDCSDGDEYGYMSHPEYLKIQMKWVKRFELFLTGHNTSAIEDELSTMWDTFYETYLKKDENEKEISHVTSA